ncbi:MAG: hypothetical protein Q9208_003545 [Pyrenodesmia sp. 3 TL-2023]
MVNLLHEQELLLKDPETPELLAKATSSLSALEAIMTRNSADELGPSRSYDFEETLALFPCENDLERWRSLRDHQRMSYPVCRPFMAIGSDYPDLASLPLANIVRALSIAAPEPKVLKITASTAVFMETGTMWLSEKCLQAATYESLRSITLHLFAYSGSSPSTSEFSQIGCFLGNAVSLTHIQLECRSDKGVFHVEPINQFSRYFAQDVLWDISEMINRIRLPYLKSLQIHRFCITEDSFTSFMRFHAQKLRYVSFFQAHMQSPGDRGAIPFSRWQRAITEVAPLMSLDHVELCLFEDSWLSSKLRHKQFLSKEGLRTARAKIRARYTVYCREVCANLQGKGHVGYPDFERTFERLEASGQKALAQFARTSEAEKST